MFISITAVLIRHHIIHFFVGGVWYGSRLQNFNLQHSSKFFHVGKFAALLVSKVYESPSSVGKNHHHYIYSWHREH